MLKFGITPEEFICSFYEKRPYFSSRGYTPKSRISWAEISAIMEVWNTADGRAILYKNGRLPESCYSERYQDIDTIQSRLLPERIREYLTDGASLVLNRLEKRSTHFSNMCLELSNFINENATLQKNKTISVILTSQSKLAAMIDRISY